KNRVACIPVETMKALVALCAQAPDDEIVRAVSGSNERRAAAPFGLSPDVRNCRRVAGVDAQGGKLAGTGVAAENNICALGSSIGGSGLDNGAARDVGLG